MTEQTFRPGETVDITIRGARVVGMNAEDVLCIEYVTDSPDLTGDKTFKNNIVISSPQMTVVRVAPAEWPPQPGDLWRDRFGDLHFCLRVDGTDNLGMFDTHGQDAWPSNTLRDFGPLTLVHREPADGAR